MNNSLKQGGAAVATAALLAVGAAANQAGAPTHPQPKPVVIDQPTGPIKTSQGILTLEVSPDSIALIRVAQGVITRVAMPDEAKTAICGDLFDPATNTGSFVIDRNGKDVFIKPVQSKGQSNLFIKSDTNVYAFDLLIVPSAQAYRVVNVNQPSYKDRLESDRKQIEADRRQMEAAMEEQLQARKREIDQQNVDVLETERRRLRAEADRRAGEYASRRLADGIMQGLNGLPLVERRGKFEQVSVELGTVAYTFEGKLFVPYKVVNGGTSDLTYREPRILVRTGGPDGEEARLTATTYTSLGEYRVDAGETAQGVVVFERPTLEAADRLVFVLQGTGEGNRTVQLRLQ